MDVSFPERGDDGIAGLPACIATFALLVSLGAPRISTQELAFEVASIKRNAPDSPPGRGGFQPGGRYALVVDSAETHVGRVGDQRANTPAIFSATSSTPTVFGTLAITASTRPRSGNR